MLERRLERTADEVELDQVATAADVLARQRAVEQVHVASSVGRYIVELVGATRASPRVQVGSSPRGSLALLKVARAKAALAGRDFVTPEDVKAVAVPTLAHRLILRPELWVRRVRTEDVVAELLEQVPTPPPEAEPAPVRTHPGR
jgi:MoxR-like ATPase